MQIGKGPPTAYLVCLYSDQGGLLVLTRRINGSETGEFAPDLE